MKNELEKYLTSEERSRLLQESMELKEDIDFFELYVKRNKKSKFEFEITPHYGGQLMRKLYRDCYQYFKKDLFKMLTEVEVAKKAIVQLYDESHGEETINTLANDDIKVIYFYFENIEIDLMDYIGDFVGCSSGCEAVKKQLQEILD